MLNLVWVKTLLAVVELGSFQDAALRLGIAQPTVSQHIRKLEEQLGVLLIHRSRTGCAAAPAALALLPFAQSLLRLSDRTAAAAKGGHLRIGASSNIGIYLLQPHVRTFAESHGHAAFDLVIDRNPVIAGKLEDGEIDIAVMEWWDGRLGFAAERWRREPVVLIVWPGHPLAERAAIDKDELRGLALLGGEPGTGTGRLIAEFLGDSSSGPHVSRQLGSTEAVKQAVKARLGISLVLRSSVDDEIRNGSLLAVPLAAPSLTKDLYVIWRDSGVGHLPAPAFVRHLLAGIEQPTAETRPNS